jgi:hypothetical protein
MRQDCVQRGHSDIVCRKHLYGCVIVLGSNSNCHFTKESLNIKRCGNQCKDQNINIHQPFQAIYNGLEAVGKKEL